MGKDTTCNNLLVLTQIAEIIHNGLQVPDDPCLLEMSEAIDIFVSELDRLVANDHHLWHNASATLLLLTSNAKQLDGLLFNINANRLQAHKLALGLWRTTNDLYFYAKEI